MILCVIQARMGSRRLPGKMLKAIGGKTTIQHVVHQVSMASAIDHIVVATTVDDLDEPLASAVAEENVEVYRGDSDDVLERYCLAAMPHQPAAIVRITGDCPFVDPIIIDNVVEEFRRNSEFDYVSNVHPATYPDGMDVEVIRFETLKQIRCSAKLRSEREHVTLRAWKNPDIYKLGVVRNETDNSDIRITLDEPEDLDLLNTLMAHMGGVVLPCQQIVEIFRATPNLQDINSMHKREEGLRKSIEEEQLVD